MESVFLMKNILKITDFIDIKISTIILIVLSCLFGEAKLIAILFLIALIHELFHFLGCLICGVKTNKIEFLPFGVSLVIDDNEKISSMSQLIIYLLGPSSLFFNIIWLKLLYRHNLINDFTYDFIYHINFFTCFFNLLPIYPLDGYIVTKALLQLVFPYKKALKISNVISILFFFLFILFNIYYFQPMLVIFLFVEQIKHIKSYKQIYINFLLYKSDLKKEKKIKSIKDYNMYKDANNFKIENKKILTDKEIAIIELKRYI